jgi:hypothetical protein
MARGLALPGWACALALSAVVPALAQGACLSNAAGGGVPRIEVPTLVTAAPRIDGRADDPAWAHATCVVMERDVFPEEGVPASEPTEIRILRSADTLYVAVRAQDRNPAGIVARQLVRDSDLYNDDHFTLVIDPYGGRRDGYIFEVNPLGARRDGLVYDGSRVRSEWDGLWDAEASIDEGGWTAEMEIPLALLSFKPGLDEWGFNAERRIARSGEVMRWRTWDRDKDVTSLQDAGELAGMSGLASTQSLRIKASGVLRDAYGTGDHDGSSFEPSADLFWRPVPELSAVLTFNTDFAEADVDERLVNLTRFPLFLPEKRDFFLQDAGIFNFAGTLDDGSVWGPVPFFSRRIGLDADGHTVDLKAGAKVTGRAGPVSFGFLGTQVGASETTPKTELGVARLLAQVTDKAEVGLIGTSGDPEQDASNSLIGADFHLRDTNFAHSGKILEGYAWLQETRTGEPDSSGKTVGFRVAYPNTGWNWNAAAMQIDEDFDPALGFVEQTGIRRSYGEFGYLFRPEGFNAITPQVDWDVRSRIDGGLEFRSINPEVYFENVHGDYIFPELFFDHERLFEPFEILPGIVVPPGTYNYTRYYLDVGTSRDRVVYGGLLTILGEYLTGHRNDVSVFAGWRPVPLFGANASYSQNDIDLPEGRFIVRVVSFDMDVNFSTRLTTRLVVQHDNVSEDLGASWRLRWIVGRDNDIFVVFNHNWSTQEGMQTISRESIAKVAWNFLF